MSNVVTSSIKGQRLQLVQRWLWLPLLVGVVVFVGQYLAFGDRSLVDVGWGPIVADDVVQARANAVLPVPQDNFVIRQTFVPHWDNLREVEVQLAQVGTVDDNGRFRLQLFDDTNTLIAEQDLTSSMFVDGQIHRFRFAPQTHSANRMYALVISGSATNSTTVYGYTLESYAAGDLTLDAGPLATAVPDTPAQELRFTTRYELGWRNTAVSLGTVLYFDGGYLLLALLFVSLPGCLLLWQGPVSWRLWDPLAWWITAVSLGISVWALLWFGLTLAGGRLSGWLLWLLFGIGWLVAMAAWWRGRPKNGPAVPLADRWRWSHVWLLLLIFMAVTLRLLAVRSINVLPWVDAGRHSLITAVMSQTGQIPNDYADFLPVSRFPYHFGFHTLAASLHLMTGWELNYMLLYLGQLLNGLVPLAVYAAAWFTTRQRRIGLIAALLVALPFFFPAYYAAWGRLTQLTAMLMMPVLLGLTWQLVRGARRWRQVWWLVGVLAAGLFLVHFRVFVYYVPFVAVVWLISLGRNGRYLAAAAGLALLLVAARIPQLLRVTNPETMFSSRSSSYNDFPTAYLNTGWEWGFVYLACAGVLLVVIDRLRRQRWSILPAALVLWVALLIILLGGERVGLPVTGIVNYNSMYITLFAPLAIFLGVTAVALLRWLGRIHWLALVLGTAALGMALAAATIFGVRYQINMLNPQTILVQPADLNAIDWIDNHLPPDAKIGVNSWLWLGGTWSGSDGSVWIVPLTKRATTTPPADYVYDAELAAAVTAYNEAATAVSDWSAAEVADWLRQEGVTHLYIGPRGGFMTPEALAANPALRMVYGRDGAFIFAIVPE